MKGRGPRLPADILDVVFSWSLGDIFNEELYADKVEDIPQTFQSVKHYMGSFVYPLLEETRLALRESMEAIADAPFSEIVAVKGEPFSKYAYVVEVRPWRNESISGSKEIYKPSPGDVFLLTDIRPETPSDLGRKGGTYMLSSITRVEDDGKSLTCFRLRASKTIGDSGGMDRSLIAIFLLNITTSSHIWKALGTGNGIAGNLDIIQEILCTNATVSNVGGVCDICSYENMDDDCARGLPELNDSQIEAIFGSIREIRCDHKSSVRLIWGPPGTGKTKVISELLWLLFTMNCKVLTCASTNITVLELASRLLNLIKRNCQKGAEYESSCCSLGEIILLGNKNHLKIVDDSALCDILLDNRVKRLEECLAPSGLGYCITSMIEFLEDCTSQYRISVENENYKQNQENEDEETKENKESKGTTTFLQFVKKRFVAIASSLRRFTISLCTHLPSNFVSGCNFDSMTSLLNLLEQFESLLSQADAVDSELEEIFGTSEDARYLTFVEMIKGGENVCPSSILLCTTRHRCLCILKSLQHSLNIPQFFDKKEIRDLCLHSASIVFCTTCYSFELLGKKPFNLLIIDEASQLKECESVIPLQLLGVRHAILLGDECQLPATVKSKVSKEARFARSLFERLTSLGYPRHMLRLQYRMHPSISSFPNDKFYSGQVLDSPNVTCKSYEKHYLPGRMYGTYSFINVADGREEFDDFRQSWKNMVEVAVVLQIVQNVFKARNTVKQKISIGIISPYSAQVASIHEKLARYCEIDRDIAVKVGSTDGFQGSEEDIIIISTVRSNVDGFVGSLSSPQTSNVALTRARHCLWIVGNAATLTRSYSIWETLVQNAKDRGCFFNADEDRLLAKTIVNIKNELDEIGDLLNKDSVLFRTARWEVLFSDSFKKSFGEIRSIQIKKAVITLLLKLASGWRPKKYIDCACEDPLQLVKHYRVEGLNVVCTIGIMKYSEYVQVLKVWDILSSADVPILMRRLSAIFVAYTDDYINCCKMKHFEGKLEVPISWKNGFDIVQYRNLHRHMLSKDPQDDPLDGGNYAENSKVSESLLLMKFYSLSSGVVNHLISGADGKELDLPFELTDEEREIILFPKSTFILGRSGTGKTTVLTMKLIQREQQHSLSSAGLYTIGSYSSQYPHRKNEVKENAVDTNENKLRQLFVTVSPMLCSAIKNYICCLKRFTSGGDFFADNNFDDMHDIDDRIVEFADIPDSFVDIPSRKYPLIITFRKFLMMLDGSLTNSFFKRFGELKKLPLNEKGYSFSPAFRSFIRRKEVNYECFTAVYWPHLNNQLTRKLDSSVVFKEIISHIKGGWAISEDCNGVLNREDYAKLSEGRVSTINSEMRELIFDIFLDYEKMKLKRGDFDLPDLVIDLHRRLRATGGLVGDKMDFVYVEVQDLTMQQIALFKYVCNNFDEGFLFAGDTAQTVARGIDFRFEDIRSLYYTEYLFESRVVASGKEKGKDNCISDLFNLTQNFRTHAGVLKLAQSVVDLLYCYFPQSIDRSVPETSLIDGEAPVLLECQDDENAIATIFGGFGGDSSCNISKCFGAEQVILVRDDASRKEISGHVGKQALVLTIIECKGLEFQDVLLYNFFGSSPLKDRWRVIFNYMQSHNLMDLGLAKSFPRFEMSRHNVLCSELKQLYVAITRTRQRLWICENNTEYSKPMFEYWKSLSLVHARQLDGAVAQAMQVVSSKDEWKTRGIKLYREGNFEIATMCFERAEDTYGEKCARAAGLQASAYRMLPVNADMAHTSLIEAAEIYVTIEKWETAAGCYFEAKEFQKAGTIFLEKCGDSRYEDAGECFWQARCWSLAAEAYAKGSKFSNCLSACSEGKLFEKGRIFILHWKESACPDDLATSGQNLDEISDSFLVGCVLHYHKVKDKHNMLTFARAFTSMEYAGKRFYQAKCWSLAAEAYAKGKKFFECLSACVKGMLIEMGLNFIDHWKDNATPDDVAANSQNVDEMKDSFLERCVSYYHEIKNKDSTLKFVRAFSSVEYARTFLRCHDYSDELLLVEEELGNFLEAANVAKLKGDLVLEADMLAKAGNFEEASRLILFHVVVNSLWSSGRKGWSLKQFKGKNELLKRAELLAQKCSSCFCEYVRVESVILSDTDNMSHLVKSMNSGLGNKSVRAEIFSAFKLLDLHFQLEPSKYFWESDIKSTSEKHAETMLLKHVMSAETLLYLWNFWKGKILNVLVFLSLGGDQDENDYFSYGEFCLEYLGARKQRDGKYIVLISEASWTKVLDPRVLSWVGGHLSVRAYDLLSAAKSYWDLELVSVGMKVLKTLAALWKFCVDNVDSPFSQGTVLLHIYRVSKFLLESELLSSRVHTEILQSFLDLSKVGFFNIAFPLDWRQTATWNMFYLWQQDVALQVLKEILAENLNMKNGKLTHGQIGRVVMLLLSCGMPGETLYPKIWSCFDVSFPPWRTFLEALEQNKHSYQQVPLIISLENALYDTFNLSWQEEVDYISPHCFMYLVEHLLYLASACQRYCFTTKSSLMKAIISPECEKNFIDLLLRHTCSKRRLSQTFDFVARLVNELLSDRHITVQWIRRSKTEVIPCYPLLVLRMVIMICLVYMNSADACHFELLVELLGSKDVSSELPQPFLECLLTAGKSNFCKAFAHALEVVGDSLVIVSFEENSPKQPSLNPIIINLETAMGRKDILDALMPSQHKDQSNRNGHKGKRNNATHTQAETPGCVAPRALGGGEKGKPSVKKLKKKVVKG